MPRQCVPFRPAGASQRRRRSRRTPRVRAGSLLLPGLMLIRILMSHSDSRPPTRANHLKCRHCRAEFSLVAPGTAHRNHCPWCLWSVHLDQTPGDRAADCGGSMEPIAVAARPDGEWLLVHQCRTCFAVHVNRIAGDDYERELLGLAVRPLRLAPFPI